MAETAYIPRLKQQYQDVLRGELIKEFGYANPMQVPRLDKVVLNMGVGEGVADSKKVTAAAADLALIAGQKPVITRRGSRSPPSSCARACRSAPRSRLRQNRMVRVRRSAGEHRAAARARLPRTEPKSFDGRGNFTLGLKEHIIFPEINFDKVEEIWGMDIVVCTTAPTDDEARALLKHLNFPFRS